VPSYFYESRHSSSIQPYKSKTIIPPHQKKYSPVKCDNCQGYGCRVDTCASLFGVVIINGVSTAAPKLYSTISPVITSVLKQFSDIPKEFQDKPPPTCDTQLEIESDSGEFTYHSNIDSDFDEHVDDDFAMTKLMKN